ncbi:MAG: hypothetical protein ACXWUZ_11355 [Allosphingosinicella sp.]
MAGAIDNLFSRGVRMVHEEAVELTLQSLRAYWPLHRHVAVAWSGGKDSTATLTLLIHLSDAGELSRPERLYVFYADTRQELPPLQAAADAIVAKLAQHDWIEMGIIYMSADPSSHRPSPCAAICGRLSSPPAPYPQGDRRGLDPSPRRGRL